MPARKERWKIRRAARLCRTASAWQKGKGRKKADLPFRLPLCAGPAGEGAYGGKWAAAAYWEMPGYCLCTQAFPFQHFNLSQPVRGCQGLKKRRSRRHSSLHGRNAQYPPAAFSKAGRLLQVCAIKKQEERVPVPACQSPAAFVPRGLLRCAVRDARQGAAPSTSRTRRCTCVPFKYTTLNSRFSGMPSR